MERFHHARWLGLIGWGAAFILAAPRLYSQSAAPSDEFIAFRVDDKHVVATVSTPRGVDGRQVREGLSPSPVARFGYEYFEPPDFWGTLPNDHHVGDRRWIHTAPGQAYEATVERRVGGYFGGCTEAIGVLLRIAPANADAFRAVRPRYFVATPTPAEAPNAAIRSAIRALPESAITGDVRRSLESMLQTTLARELPRVRSKDAPGLAVRAVEGQYRSDRIGARERLKVLDALERGEGKLRYEVQAFRLRADHVPILFVRAEWIVGWRHGLAGSLWLRGSDPLEVLEATAAWGMSRPMSFDDNVHPFEMGLILNVLDRDGDGWGEVLLSMDGYESRTISLLEYSPAGFQRAIALSGGC